MAPSRFGASKYRNSLPHIPPREEFYRSQLPPFSASQSNSSTTTTFSSEIKTNREWIVILTANGDLSYRGYTGDAGVEKVGKGGGVGDWDLSRLEDNVIAVGGLDGSIGVYSLPVLSSTPSPLTVLHTIPPTSQSPITNLILHPTTPNIVLASTLTNPLAIYDVSSPSTSPLITLNASEPKGLWSIAWSSNGRLIGVIGKSGILSIYDPRLSKDPIKTKNLSFSMQALKPSKITWVGQDIFLTSYSKPRNRQYSLLIITKDGIETKFTETLDTSPGILIPLVDEERKIVYMAGRGDMFLRQIELSGPIGYQETPHPLPFPLSSGSMALKNQTELDVMNAEIARVILPVVDKDGDALLPLGIRVPRRQLIDYHEDLYPDVQGTVPEQNAEQWFRGDDQSPLSVTLDPARRNTWEGRIEEYKKQRGNLSIPSATSVMAPEVTVRSSVAASAVTANSGSAETASNTTPPSNVTLDSSVAKDAISKSSSPSSTESKPKITINPKLPLLQDNETYSSTSYKSRIVADYLAVEFEKHKGSDEKGPLMVGLQGPQGCGKTTLCSGFVEYLKNEKSLKAAVLSLDDLYKTHEGLKTVATQHPKNALLAGRGPPGTHDTELAKSVIGQVMHINDSTGESVKLPVFDKSLCGGEGDRSQDTVSVSGPIDVFILEGWSMGFAPLSKTSLETAYSNPVPASPATSDTYFTKHPLSSLQTVNEYLSSFSEALYSNFKAFVQVEPLSYDYVFDWRLQQERAMKEKNGGKGMTDEQVHKFVERYMPGYELWKEGIWNQGTGWAGRGLKLVFGSEREVLNVSQPRSSETTSTKVDEKEEKEKKEEKVKESEKGDIQLVKVDKIAEEKVIQTGEKDLAVKVEIPPKSEVSPFPPPALSSTTSSKEFSQPTKEATPPAKERYNPNWSRKFLAGKAPLIPTYDSLPALSSLHQDSKTLKANARVAFFPIQGTGGRLNVHPLSKKGRLSVGGEGYLTGGVEISDFDVELGGDRVAVAGEDGVVRLWNVGEQGVQGVGPEPEQVLKGKGIDKITQIAFHSTAENLLVGLTNDFGQSSIRFWDLAIGEEASVVAIPVQGVFNFTFSPDGERVAIAAKDNRILVLDPRNPSKLISGKAYDSPRSFQTAWIDRSHLVTIGFSRGSQRKINLYHLPSAGDIETLYSITIDVSPSVLFPAYDPDTSILYVWGKGERVVQAYEVNLEHKEPISKLPSYTAGSPQLGLVFLPKRTVDVKKVEIAKCLRLTAKTMEVVSFSIPRNKPEFFQDDIYVPTLDVESYANTAQEWLNGQNKAVPTVELRPEGMEALSQAPKIDSAAKKKFVPAANVMSEEEKKKQEMDALFAKAKMDESSDEEIEQKGLAAPDDDW
ncbi:uncharacterized protein IL334_003933 [Kwoniella shivajii]|uniref:Actin cross-linking n=1 Tax=Kwoniella shivajii TaxID=564305 RepID=A0ABZ1CYY5_9TREE|nr:hypothetical protein IL334_003933 [Kwoniella shivajii]